MIPYKPFAKHLTDSNVLASPSELHGHASGMIAANKDLESREWIKLILEDYCFESKNKEKLIPVLKALFEFAQDKLKADNYTYSALLPSDDTDLSYRLEALSSWCSSFLTGLAYSGLQTDQDMHQDAHEFILDLEKIAKVDHSSEGSQGEEADFVELVEYIKAGTMLLYLELLEQEVIPK